MQKFKHKKQYTNRKGENIMTVNFEDLNVTLGNRKELQDSFTPHFEELNTVYSELRALEDVAEETAAEDKEALETLEQNLSEIEESLTGVTDLAIGKQFLTLKEDTLKDIELQKTIMQGRNKTVAKEMTAKVIEFYDVMRDVTINWNSFRKEIVLTASVNTIKEDNAVISAVISRTGLLMSSIKSILTDAGILKNNGHFLTGGEKRVYLDTTIRIPEAETNVLDALKIGAQDINGVFI